MCIRYGSVRYVVVRCPAALANLLWEAECPILLRQAVIADICVGMWDRVFRSLGQLADEIFIGFH